MDARTEQWVEAFANPATLPSSECIVLASAPIGTVGDAGYFDDSGAYIVPAQLIWPDGTTNTLASSSDGEPMLQETEVRETAQPMLPEDFRRQEIEYRNSTEVQPPQRSLMELVEMSHSPVDSYSAQEYREAAAQYRASMGADFRRDSIYNGLWTRAAALDAAAGGGWGQEVINDITGFATEEGLHAQTGVAIGGALGRGIGSRLGNSVDTVLGTGGKNPDGDVPPIGSGLGDVSTNGAAGGVIQALDGALPNAGKAVIDPNKLMSYALNPLHPVGGNKARVFESVLGYNQSNADQLIGKIQQGALTNPAVLGKADQFGQRFTVDMSITGPNGNSAVVRTGWIFDPGSTVPRLATAYVK
jgi:hypothetical protein